MRRAQWTDALGVARHAVSGARRDHETTRPFPRDFSAGPGRNLSRLCGKVVRFGRIKPKRRHAPFPQHKRRPGRPQVHGAQSVKDRKLRASGELMRISAEQARKKGEGPSATMAKRPSRYTTAGFAGAKPLSESRFSSTSRTRTGTPLSLPSGNALPAHSESPKMHRLAAHRGEHTAIKQRLFRFRPDIHSGEAQG